MKDDGRKDVFISYASEDREDVARPLADLLIDAGVTVWFDQTHLKIGDSLREAVDRGLAECRYGVVIISPSFFRKHFTNQELSALMQREVHGDKTVLPVWHGVADHDVRGYSLTLADRIAAKWEDGLLKVADSIIERVRPDLLGQFRDATSIIPMPELLSGREVTSVIQDTHVSLLEHDPPTNDAERDLVSTFLQNVFDWGEMWSQIEPSDHVKARYSFDAQLVELRELGWRAYGCRRIRTSRRIGDPHLWAILVLLREVPSAVASIGDFIAVVRDTCLSPEPFRPVAQNKQPTDTSEVPRTPSH